MQQISPSPPCPSSAAFLHHASARRGRCGPRRALEKSPFSAITVVAPASSSPPASFSSSLLVLDPPPRVSPLVFLLPPVKSARRRLASQLPLKCRLRDLEILSVKELPDGSLHFSFGIPNGTDELAFSSGKSFTNKMASSCRPPSGFTRRSPIPVVTPSRRKKLDYRSVKEDVLNTAPGTMVLLRPKSCFVKRSPIPKPANIERKKLLVQRVVDDGGEEGNLVGSLDIANDDKPKRWPSRFVKRSPIPLPHGRPSILQDAIAGSSLEILENANKPVRWPSRFVKRSPIPSVHQMSKIEVKVVDAVLVKPNRWPSRFIKKSPIPPFAVRCNNLEKSSLDATMEIRRNASAFQTCRPKSKFIRRSPLAKMHHYATAVSRVEILGDSNSIQSARPTSAFIKKSPIIKVHHHALIGAGMKGESQGEQSIQKTIDEDANQSSVGKIPEQLTVGSDDNVLVDLGKYKLPELKSLAKTRGLKGYSKLRKAELLALLKGQL